MAASMGPRSHERGNVAAVLAEVNSKKPLQWGRVLTNAETLARNPRGNDRPPASMGPRSHERGNAKAHRHYLVTILLQWGRVLTNAETLRGFFDQPVVRLASMGPRSHERGNPINADHQPEPHSASMGPRSHEHGNRGYFSSAGDSWRRFNGAAFSRTRKHVASSLPSSYAAPLQWGRVLTNAETKFTRRGGRRMRALQWGRVLTNAETFTTRRSARAWGKLQWGRVLTNAETAPTLSLDRTGRYLPCFERHLEWASILALDSYGRRV